MQTNQSKIDFNFIMPTFIFCIVGVFIPAFSAIFLFGIQMLLTQLGIECSNAWTIIWTFTWAGMIILPLIFIIFLAKENHQQERSLIVKLILFNVLEYVFIQASLGSLMSSGKMVCYGKDGQNGLELILTAWISLPILFIFGLIFNYLWKRKD
jgi:hypothetical protein